MITHFKIKNFKSILDVDVNLEFAEGKAPNGFKKLNRIVFFEPVQKQRYIPCFAIYGANASGKSNIILAFRVFKGVIVSGIEKNFHPNKINQKYTSTTFDIGFIIDKTPYNYIVEYKKDEIIRELFLKKDETIYETDKQKKSFDNLAKEPVYTTNYINEVFNVQCCDDKGRQIRTLLSVIAKNFTGLNEYVVKIYQEITEKMFISPNYFPATFEEGFAMISETGSDSLYIKEGKNIFEKIVQIIKKLDIDIEKMEIRQESDKLKRGNVLEFNKETVGSIANVLYTHDDKKIVVEHINTYHKDTEGKDVMFDFQEESYGTRILTGLIGTILITLDKGATLIIDELDKSLHSLIITEIVKIFKDKDYNTHNSQIIFTSHNTDILDSDTLRLSEIGIVNKNLHNGTMLKRLSGQKGLRNVTNFRKQYLEGVFSGIPFPYI